MMLAGPPYVFLYLLQAKDTTSLEEWARALDFVESDPDCALVHPPDVVPREHHWGMQVLALITVPHRRQFMAKFSKLVHCNVRPPEEQPWYDVAGRIMPELLAARALPWPRGDL
jgi:hypothetical protein